MTNMNHADFALAGGIQELNFHEMEQVDGGCPPCFLAAALTTTALFSFVRGIFHGARLKATAEAEGVD